MKRKIAAIMVMALLGCSATACGLTGGEPDIDEGLHIAADDAQQRIDRDDTHTDVQGEDDSNFDDDDDDETIESYPIPDGEDEEGSEPQGPDWQYTSDTEAQDDSSSDQTDFWINYNTYDLIGYAKSVGCKVSYGSITDPTDPTQLNYCDLEFGTGKSGDSRYMTIYSFCYESSKKISTCATGWQVLGSDDKSDINSYLDGNIYEKNWQDLIMVYIQNENFWMPQSHLYATQVILERIGRDDPECWLRELGINHVGQSMHDD